MTTKTKKAARKPAAKKTTTKAPAAKAAAPANEQPRATMWRLAQKMLVGGKTNAEILAALKDRFDLPKEHDYYPRWCRSYATKLGLTTKSFAKEHAGAPVRKAVPAKA